MAYLITKNSSLRDYSKAVSIGAPGKVVYHLLTSIDGLRSWWGNPVHGSPKKDGKIRFEHENPEQFRIMAVDQVMPPVCVRWTVEEDTNSEWQGTSIVFNINHLDDMHCEMYVQHIGLTPELPAYPRYKQHWDEHIRIITQKSESIRMNLKDH